VVRLSGLLQSNAAGVFSNASYLVGSTLTGSIFGFAFWLVAARLCSPSQVGLGAAYISALTLLTVVTDLGLSSVVIRFARGLGTEWQPFVNTAVSIVTLASLVVAVVFALGTPLWSPSMSDLAGDPLVLTVFVFSTALFGLALFIDKIFVAFEIMKYMFWRNVLSNAVRVAAIVVTARVLGATGLVLAAGIGSIAGIALACAVLLPRTGGGLRLRPTLRLHLLRAHVGYSAGNHFATLVWGIPPQIYPLMVVSILGPGVNAQFYINWMIANLLFIVPVAISTSAFARASNTSGMQQRQYWAMMWLTVGGLVVPAVALILAAPFVLHIFGSHYSQHTGYLFDVLVLSVFPYTINTAIVTHHRVTRAVGRMMLSSGTVTGLSLVLSAVLGTERGLTGIGVGWLIGQCLGLVVSWLTVRGVRLEDRLEHRVPGGSARTVHVESA
jgi:O-antigen/teichoic acid export membrane protein